MNDRAIFTILVLRRAHTHTYSGMYIKINTLKLISRRNYTIFRHRRKKHDYTQDLWLIEWLRTKTVFD